MSYSLKIVVTYTIRSSEIALYTCIYMSMWMYENWELFLEEVINKNNKQVGIFTSVGKCQRLFGYVIDILGI